MGGEHWSLGGLGLQGRGAGWAEGWLDGRRGDSDRTGSVLAVRLDEHDPLRVTGGSAGLGQLAGPPGEDFDLEALAIRPVRWKRQSWQEAAGSSSSASWERKKSTRTEECSS